MYVRQCRCQVHVYAAMPLASTCICGNANGKFMYMRQCRWEAAMPRAKSCICGNAAGKRQCRGQVHVYAAMPLGSGNAAGKFMYTRQCRFLAQMRCRINIIAHHMGSKISHTRCIPLQTHIGDKTSLNFACKPHLQVPNSPSRWQR